MGHELPGDLCPSGAAAGGGFSVPEMAAAPSVEEQRRSVSDGWVIAVVSTSVPTAERNCEVTALLPGEHRSWGGLGSSPAVPCQLHFPASNGLWLFEGVGIWEFGLQKAVPVGSEGTRPGGGRDLLLVGQDRRKQPQAVPGCPIQVGY